MSGELEPWQAAFEEAADGFALSTTKALNVAFAMEPWPGLEQPVHCLAIMSGAIAAAAQQAAALATHARSDPEEMRGALHRVLDDHFNRKLAIVAAEQGGQA